MPFTSPVGEVAFIKRRTDAQLRPNPPPVCVAAGGEAAGAAARQILVGPCEVVGQGQCKSRGAMVGHVEW